MQKAKEGDLLETNEGLIFDVKGFYHPKERTTAYLRYYPSPKGERERNGVLFKKVYDLKERESFLRKNFPHYLYEDRELGLIQAVPATHIRRIYEPRSFLLPLKKGKKTALERKSFDFCTLLSKTSGVPLSSFGVSGSLLVGLPEKNSDIDVIVYWKENSKKIYETLKKLREKNITESFKGKMLHDVCHFRWGYADREINRIEKEKLLHGTFFRQPYFVRLLRKPRKETYTQMGVRRIEGKVVDDKDGIFTPCVYEIESKKAERLLSFRGRYCEHLRRGDRFSVEARVENVSGRYRQVVLEGEKIEFF